MVDHFYSLKLVLFLEDLIAYRAAEQEGVSSGCLDDGGILFNHFLRLGDSSGHEHRSSAAYSSVLVHYFKADSRFLKDCRRGFAD